MLLGHVIESWERSLRARNRSPKTIKSYVETAWLLNVFLEKSGASTSVPEIRREQVEMFIDDQLRRWRPATAAVRFRSLKPFFAWLVNQGYIAVSPMEKLRSPRVPSQSVPVVPDEHLRKLIGTCCSESFEDRRDAAILRVMIETGVRLSEIAGLHLRDIDLEHSELAVVGKGRRPRVVPFGHKAHSAIDRYLAARVAHRHNEISELWVGPKGRLTNSGIAQMLSRRCVRAGIPMIHPHQFRHTAAHNWLAIGGSEGDAMRLFGWSSREMLSRYGAALADERAHAAYRRLAPGDRI